MKESKRVAVVGGGIMGLTAAYELSKKGYQVTVFEKDKKVGGMSATFDFDGLEIERYYHFFCKSDKPFFDLLKELNLESHLKWNTTKMGFFYEGTLYKWGTPTAFLKFPHLGLIAKLRFAFHVFLSVHRTQWDRLHHRSAIDWIKRYIGEETYEMLWSSLLRLKFHEYRHSLSAEWVRRRLRRMGRSRDNMFTERLGYMEGGVGKLLDTLVSKITNMGGIVRVNSGVTEVTIAGGKVSGVVSNGEKISFDQVLTTVPLPYIPTMIPSLPDHLLTQYTKLENLGVVCVILKLKHRLTENFWLNVNDRSMELPGIIEFSNINPLHEKIAYFPFYLHRTHPNFIKSDDEYIELVKGYCKKISKNFNEDWILGGRVHRYEYAQPVCIPGFTDNLPPVQTEIKGLSIMDTSHHYPEDRSMSESVLLAQKTTVGM